MGSTLKLFQSDGKLEALNRDLAMEEIELKDEFAGIGWDEYNDKYKKNSKYKVIYESDDPKYQTFMAEDFKATVTVFNYKKLQDIVSFIDQGSLTILENDHWLVYSYGEGMKTLTLYDAVWAKMYNQKEWTLDLIPIRVVDTEPDETEITNESDAQLPDIKLTDLFIILMEMSNKIDSMENRIAKIESRTNPTHVTIKGGKIIKKEVKRIEEEMYGNLECILDEWLPAEEDYLGANYETTKECVKPFFERHAELLDRNSKDIVARLDQLTHRINTMEVNIMDCISKVDVPKKSGAKKQ